MCAYGIVAYFRFIREHNVKYMIIASKSTFVPLSQEPSIPCLELQAAVIVTTGDTSKQNKTQLIIPHVIKLSYPVQRKTLGFIS